MRGPPAGPASRSGCCWRRSAALLVISATITYAADPPKPGDDVASARPFRLPEFSLAEVKDPSLEVLKQLTTAISEVGLVALTDAGHPAALHHYAHCVAHQDLGTAALRVLMDAGSVKKTTVASFTNLTGAQPLPQGVDEQCPEFSEAAVSLRKRVDLAGRAYARVLDRIFQGAPAAGPVPRGAGDSYVDMALRGESLEHFHFFEKQASDSSAGPLLDLHSDMGLFIVMTAAEYVHAASGAPLGDSNSRPQHGFFLELPSGELVRPLVPPGSLLVMNGEGAQRWVRSPGGPGMARPYAPAHEVLMPDAPGLGRAWFGRMFLPAADATLQDSGSQTPTTFGEYRRQTVGAFQAGEPHAASAAGCSPQRRALLAEVTDCAAGEAYCWMSCMALPGDFSCTVDEVLCASMETGQLWPDDFLDPTTGAPLHCFECGLVCPPEKENGSSVFGNSTSTFCNNALPATTMWMMGFQAAEAGNGCVAFLFEPWVLDSAGKFAAACIGTVFMGLGVEALVAFRRQYSKEPTAGPLLLKRLAMLSLYGVQVALGYLLMLVAMIYQLELFLMVIIGLTAGHGIFNLQAPVAESADACCQGQDAGEGSLQPIVNGTCSVVAPAPSHHDTNSTEDLKPCCHGGAGK